MAVLDDAVNHYRDILTDDVAALTQEQLDDQQRRRNLQFGGRPICTVLRPRMVSQLQLDFLRERIKGLIQVFRIIHEAALADESVLEQFGLTEEERLLFSHDPGFDDPCPTSRVDAFVTSETEFKITEFNAETPAAPAFNDALSEVFEGLEAMHRFQRRFEVRPLPARVGVLAGLLRSFEQWAGHRSQPPRIAIVDWREVPTFSEFVLFERYFLDHGFDCRIVDPREVEYRDGKLIAGDYHITLIYKRVLIDELITRGGMDHPIIRAVREGAVCMVNPFRCKALYKKASLAVLSDERNNRLFTPEQRRLIADHVPWTRVVQERRTEFDGGEIDLVPYILDNRSRFLLKPNDAYGGEGIVLGWDVDAPAWEQAVATASRRPFVVQERVPIPSEPYPSLTAGGVEWIDRRQDTDPYGAFGGHMQGILTRISTATLINVTAGGGSTIPTLLVEPR